MAGPPSSPYAGGKFRLKLKFPAQYPFKPPVILFETKIYHPSVSKDGEICAALIGEGWGPTLNVRHCMQVIYEILQNPSPDHPLDEEIAALLREKPKEFDKKAKKYTQKNAMD
jgi:ubiquitin-protein ligase